MVQFMIQTYLNLNQTLQMHSSRSGPKFNKITEPNLESGPEFAGFLKKNQTKQDHSITNEHSHILYGWHP
jgi:hypothetical protein